MPRRNLAGNWSGPSERVTVRLSLRDRIALDELAVALGTDRSEALRQAVREAAAARRGQRTAEST
ncbi:MAG TPA: ribbon-helix-helix protein, CopG family [Myxococcota bacterium]|nr:ribbon-helix-helix protein, CopG family [Myxococcota bacterium]